MINNSLRYVLIMAVIDQNIRLAREISLNPTYTNGYKNTKLRTNDGLTRGIIDKLIKETTQNG